MVSLCHVDASVMTLILEGGNLEEMESEAIPWEDEKLWKLYTYRTHKCPDNNHGLDPHNHI